MGNMQGTKNSVRSMLLPVVFSLAGLLLEDSRGFRTHRGQASGGQGRRTP